tara:strand:+ start:60 stop:407 length:348 start_codon:yes stop_codon:yes gene_type:complete
MIKKESLFLKDILENIKDIEEFSEDLTQELLDKDKLRQKAIIKSLEIIGEAVKNISEKLKKDYPNVDWKEIAGTRDRITHAYFDVDLNIVWEIIKKYLPILKKQIKEILNDLEKN